MLHSFSLRRAGWILAIFGVGAPAVALLILAWLSRRNGDDFNTFVGWSSIVALGVSVIGVGIAMAEKAGAISGLSHARMAAISEDFAKDAMRQYGLLLAQLLSTDALDSRAARVSFRPGSRYRQAKSRRAYRSKSAGRDVSDIVEFYLNETRRRMVVLGAPGTGKTVLAVSLAVGLLKRRAAVPDEKSQAVPIPSIFNLPSWDPECEEFTDWLVMQIRDHFRLSRKVSERLVRDGWIFPILDGLDEMDSSEGAPARAERAVALINDYIARTPNGHMVLVCRSGEKYYERLARRVRDADEITIQKLKASQMIEYIKLQCPDESDLSTWQPIFDELSSRNPSPVFSALNTPWRLTAAVTFVHSGGDPATLLPTRGEMARGSWQADYSARISEQLMGALITYRILNHRKPGMSFDSTIRRLRVVSGLLVKAEGAGNAGNEIILHQWWRVLGERKVLKTQTLAMWAVLHVPFGVMGFFWTAHSIGVRHGWIGPVALLMNYFTILLYGTMKASSKRSPITFRIGSLFSPARAGFTAIGFVVAALLGVLEGMFSGSLYGVSFGVTAAALVVLVAASTGLDPVNATRPMGTLVNDRNFALMIGIVIGAYAALYYVTTYSLAVALMFASMAVLVSIFCSSYVRYLAAAYIGGFHGLPFRFATFLSWCHSAGIMRVSGVGYQFRHQELVDYLQLS